MKTLRVPLSILIVLAGLLSADAVSRAQSLPPPDTDGDGVPDSVDLCPAENASFFDADGDGCLDSILSARHTEYWDLADLPLVYVINDQGAPGVTDGSDTTAINAAFAAWTLLGKASLSAASGGSTTQGIASALDGVNLVTFVDTEYDFGSSVLAVGLTTSFTQPTFFNGRWVRPGQIVDADIVFNPGQEFHTPSAGGGFGSDIQSVATHEVGHLFGLAHSAVETSTMFFVLPPGTSASSLEAEDMQAIFKAYPESSALASGARIDGHILDETSSPVAGGAVFLMNAATGDTVGCDFTLADGSYAFAGLDPGSYRLSIHPLDGSSSIGHLIPGYVNELVDSTAVILFIPESWDVGESSTDDPSAVSDITLAAGEVRPGVDFITNVDNTPPTVTEVIPDGSTLVRPDAAILISFDEPIDDVTIAANFRVEDTATGIPLSGAVAIFSGNQILAFTPNGGLQFGTNYRLTLQTGLSDLFGNGLTAPVIVDFSTEPRPPVSLSSILPTKGVAGTIVVVDGDGFDSNPSNDTVLFGTIAATVLQASPTQLLVEVPPNASTGPVTVVSGGNTSNGIVFTVVGATNAARGTRVGTVELFAAPQDITLLPDGRYAYIATGAGLGSVVIDAGLGGYLQATSIDLGGAGALAVSASPDGKRVYAVSQLPPRLFEIDSDSGDGALFNGVLDQIPLTATPLGVKVGPEGHFAYIPTDAGTIQVFDVERQSETYRRQINEIRAPAPSLRGPIALDPSHGRILALSGSGNLWVFDAHDGTLAAQIPVSLDPRDVVVEPAGLLAYVSDAEGSVEVIDLSTLSSSLTIPSVGSQRGISITPDGLFLFTANRDRSQVDVIDLNPANATFLTAASNLDAGIHPIDVEVSPDGLYLYTLLEDTGQLEITGIGFGPVIHTIVPKAAPVGAKVVVSGEENPFGFTVLDFDGITVIPSRGTATVLEAAVPPAFGGGPVTVLRDVGVPLGNPAAIQVSNAFFMEVLDPTPTANDRLRRAGDTPSISVGELTHQIAVSPSGDLLAVGGTAGEVQLVDIDPGSGRFNQPIAFLRQANSEVTDLAFTPDGKRLCIASLSDDAVYVLNTDRLSSGFAKDFTVIDQSTVDPSFTPEQVVMSPDGGFLVISDAVGGGLAVAGLVPDSVNENKIFGWTPPFDHPVDLTFHPGGAFLYACGSTGQVHIIDFDPTSPTYLSRIGEVVMPPDSTSGVPEQPLAASFTPDGSRCLVLTVNLDASPQTRSIVTLDCTDPAQPAVLDRFEVRAGSSLGPETIDVSPRGDRVVLNVHGLGLEYYDISSFPYIQHPGFLDANGLASTDQAWSIDGRRLYMVGTVSNNVIYFDFSGAARAEVVSGNRQTGITGQRLPAPVRIRVFDGLGAPAPGTNVTFSALPGAGVGPDDRSTYVVLTDSDGFAQTSWKLRSTVGEDTLGVFIEGVVLDSTVTATVVQDPETLPLEVAEILPLDQTTGVSSTTAIQTTFSRAVDPASVSTSTYFVQEDGATAPIPALVGFADNGRKVSLTPSTPLAYETTYHVEITSGVLDQSSGPLAVPSSTTFTTAAAPALILSAVNPPSGPAGTDVVLSGQGFDSDPSTMRVFFNEVETIPAAGSVDYLHVTVPSGAATGNVLVVDAAGDSSASMPFRVLVPTDSPVDQVVATVSTNEATRAVIVTPDGTRAYTVNPGSDSVLPIDLVGFVSLPSITVGARPVAIAITANGTRAYVANFSSNSLSIINTDPDSSGYNTVTQTIPVGLGPVDVAVSPAQDRVFVARTGEPGFDVLDSDPTSETFNKVLLSVRGGSKTKSVAVSPDGTLLYFGTDDGYLVIATTDYNSVLRSVRGRSATKSVAVSPDGSLLFVLTTEGSVDIFDVQPGSATEDQVLLSVRGGSKTKSLAISPDGTLLYLIQEGSDDILVVSLDIMGPVSVLDPNAPLPPPTLSYTIVDTITVGGDPAAVAFDPSGSGLTVVATNADLNLSILNTSSVPVGDLDAVVEVFPDSPGLSSRGRWIEGRIELPRGFFPQEIDLSTVLLNGKVPAEPDPVAIEDSDQDGLDELVIKFDRVAFQDSLAIGEQVETRISGFASDRAFAGVDTIRTIRPKLESPHEGKVYRTGPSIHIDWDLPHHWTADYAVVEWSKDEGLHWNPIAGHAPAEGSIDWVVPFDAVGTDRVLVTLFRSGEEIGMTLSGAFGVDLAVGVVQVQLHARIEGRDVVLDWNSTLAPGLSGFQILRAEGNQGGFIPIGETPIEAFAGEEPVQLQFRDRQVKANLEFRYELVEVWDGRAGARHGPIVVKRAVTNSLEQNYPNAFNPRTTIAFSTAKAGPVKLVVFDLRGRLVATLVNEFRPADKYTVRWNGLDDRGTPVSSGTYFYRLVAPGFTASRKMVLIR